MRRLAANVFEAGKAVPTPSKNNGLPVALVMHGLLGNKQNMRTMCRKLSAAHPNWRVVCPDHRGHGRSPSMSDDTPHTLQGCAIDVLSTLDAMGSDPTVVCGHSFGGKVALAVTEALRSSSNEPHSTWVLDALPGIVPETEYNSDDKESVASVVAYLRQVPLPIESKEHLMNTMKGAGFHEALALWMTTNIKPVEPSQPEQAWCFDLDTVEGVFDAYKRTEFWNLLEASTGNIHFLRAGRNPAWSPEVLSRFEQLNSTVQLHTLEGVGHWVHIEAAETVHEMLSGALLDADSG